MQYWGKLVGALGGLATGRPWMALIGLVLGHQFDRGFAERFGRLGANDDGKLAHLPAPYLQALFETMGHLAKADGRVTEQEIRAARSLMHRLGLKPGEARKAIDWFERGKSADFPLLPTIEAMRADSGRRTEMRTLFVRLLLEVGLSKHSLHRRERALLWKICQALDIGRVELAQLEATLRARGFRKSAIGTADDGRVRRAYVALGIEREATNDEIKQAYRRLMNRNHPDKIAAANPDDAAVEAAEKRTREIRSAYELLKSRRNIR